MSNTTKEIYQENQIITKSINKIIEEASTDREILAKLRNLKAATQTQLAKSQIDYYIHQIQRQHQKKARHMVLYIALLFYLLLFCTALICTCIQRLTQLHPSLVQQRNNLYVIYSITKFNLHIII